MPRTFAMLCMTAGILTGAANAIALPVEQTIVCPSELPMSALQIYKPPAGWSGFVPHEAMPGLELVGAGVMYGPPAVMAESKPDATAGRTARWTHIVAPPDGVWMACYYGEGRLMILSKRLDDRTTQCSVAQAAAGGRRVKLDIRCR